MYRKMKNCSNCICSFAINKLKIRGFFVVGFPQWNLDIVVLDGVIKQGWIRMGKAFFFYSSLLAKFLGIFDKLHIKINDKTCPQKSM
jgi:hypothetical protein